MITPSAHFTPKKDGMLLRMFQQPIRGEKVCGDGCSVVENVDETRIFVGDGLGHGPNANLAVQEAIKVFKKSGEKLPSEILREIHEGVRKTRGLVASIAIVDHKHKLWRICGIGNISTRICQGIEYRNYAPHNGTIGLNIPGRMNNYEVPAEKFQTIVMCSDGIQNRWDLMKYPSILKFDPAVMAAAIYKDYSRGLDDVTVLVGKLNY